MTSYEAVKGISFDIESGKTVAMVGQSGSGKSVTSLALMGLLPGATLVEGEINMMGKGNLLDFKEPQMRSIRGREIAMIFQEPMSALNPLVTCGNQVIECLLAHQKISRRKAREIALDWFGKVQLPDPSRLFDRYPHQLSGGQKQRVMIAMAMCNHPQLLIADEPTTALDVTVQKEIVELMQTLQREFNTAILFITHDLGLARAIADNCINISEGKITNQFPRTSGKSTVITGLSTIHRSILSVRNLSVRYTSAEKKWGKPAEYFKAVDDISFDLPEGEITGLVGESGCGKSTLSKSIIGLQAVSHGKILFEDQDIVKYNTAQWRQLRKDIQIVFQDPFASLNQRMKVGDALAEPLRVHGLAQGKHVDKHVDQLLEMVQLPSSSKYKYPHEFSGGQRQRICIARALAVRPRLLICDESVSALDVTIQEQILDLLLQLQQEKKLTYLFITHDLNVVKRISQTILVMQKGKIVEEGATADILNTPKNDYTKKLLASVYS